MSKFFRLVKATNVTLDEPNVIKYYLENDTKPKYATLEKEALKFIFDIALKFPSTVSAKIYDISPDIWREIVDLRMKQNVDFKLDDYTYVMLAEQDIVISLTSLDLQGSLDAFDAVYTKYNGYSTISAYNTMNIVFSGEQEDGTNYKPVMLFDVCISDGKYKVYSGVIKEGRYILASAPVVDETSFELFITKNFEYEMGMTIKLSDGTADRYSIEKGKNIKLSVREVIEFLKKAKIKVNTNDDDIVESFDGITNSDALLSFFDTFNMTYKSLTRLPLLRKSVKCDGLVLDDLLKIFSEDLLTYTNNIKSETIASILLIYYTEESDSLIMSDIINSSKG